MLNLKSITSLNIKGTPLKTDNLSKRIFEYKNYINDNIKNPENKDLVIISVQGLYGYRVGLIGLLFNNLVFNISKNNNPTYLQTFINKFFKDGISGNDLEIFSYGISLVSRVLPFINYGNWDLKRKLNNNKIKDYTKNISMPSIMDLNSIYLLNPLYDSGCSIYSNKIPKEVGFERWNIRDILHTKDKIYNNGITWSYFESENKQNGIIIINLIMEDNVAEWAVVSQLKQIVDLKYRLENKYCLSIDNYQTYIMGDFKLEFNINIFNQEPYNILIKSNLKIIGNSNNLTTTHFIFQSENNNKIDCSHLKIQDDDILNIEFPDKDLKNEDSISINMAFNIIDDVSDYNSKQSVKEHDLENNIPEIRNEYNFNDNIEIDNVYIPSNFDNSNTDNESENVGNTDCEDIDVDADVDCDNSDINGTNDNCDCEDVDINCDNSDINVTNDNCDCDDVEVIHDEWFYI